MAHSVGGFDLKYTSRTSWKAEVRSHGEVVAIAPVTWTKGRYTKQNSKDVFQQVWFQNAHELEEHRTGTDPFIVAVAVAKDYSHHPQEFQDFQAVFEVVAAGDICDEKSIETKVIRRVTSKDFDHAPGPFRGRP
ncbi:hypothetical protein [Bradyrhizobium sp. 145]|uniref:hypothetical protein n=1 Tax=Bradyrhizobium sp. 145 TaxID=2782621 RepID=UPI001FFA6459|nr:hypothetical protein [Bradyrhizobium sp. 145]MCK1691029.1 hypothetical protein [Bradyrhizobium sp. 145]